MRFDWYQEISKSSEIAQGDIISNCPIPIINSYIYQAIINSYEVSEEPIDIKQADIIILSQSCDILNDKIDSLIVSPVWELSKLIESNEYFKSSKARESLRQGKEPSYHLLNKYSSLNINFDYSVVDFHRIYSLPKNYINSIIDNRDYRLRLLPPYREHLSQAFARYFMRVGLPIDIEKNIIRNYNYNK